MFRKLRSHTRELSLLAASFGVTVLAGVPASAGAKWVRQHAVDCMTDGYAYNADWQDTLDVESNGVGKPSAAGYSGILELYCPIPDFYINSSNHFRKADIKTLNVHVYDGTVSGTNYARVCLTNWNVDSGYCGGYSSSGGGDSSFRGNATLKPSVSRLDDDAGDFGYVYVHGTRVRGLFYSM